MQRIPKALVLLLCCTVSVLALSPTFLACQLQKKSAEESPLSGCPTGTIFVSPVHPKAHFKSVQDAVLSFLANDQFQALKKGRKGAASCKVNDRLFYEDLELFQQPENGREVILIGEGDYHETVNVTRSGPLTLLGQLDISALSPSSNATTRNLVQIWNNAFVQTGMDDAQSAVLLVAPSFNASLIGAGPTGAPLQPLFGNTDFKAYNIDFQNRAANFAISQALVMDISYANASFYGCTFASYQDTWYTGRNASTYVVDSIIFGETDYLFGFGTAWFEHITLANRACGGGIVAWKGTNLTDAPGNRYGAYISDSNIIRSPDANATLDITGDCFLGRPWNDLATTVFLRTFMDDTIDAVGWRPFDSPGIIANTTFYAEYKNYGPGANTSRRVSDHFLTDAEATNFTIEKVFLETPQWIDFDYIQ